MLAVAVVAMIVVVLMGDCGCLFRGQADVSLHTPVHKTNLHPYSRETSSYESKLHYNFVVDVAQVVQEQWKN